jgi:hypothetical protein
MNSQSISGINQLQGAGTQNIDLNNGNDIDFTAPSNFNANAGQFSF